MRSPADDRRRMLVERALRVVALAAVLGWIVSALVPPAAVESAATHATLSERLPNWTRRGARAVSVRLDAVPPLADVTWLAALAHSGANVNWTGGPTPLAIESWPVASPAGGIAVLASAGGTRSPVLEDALGPLDTLGADHAPAAVRLASVQGDISLTTGAERATSAVTESRARALKRVYVAGAAGWEAKFVVAALEEAGWNVDARLTIGPGESVVQGSASGPDTSRHSAAILLDSASAESARTVEEFVRSGGGLILAGTASRARRVARLTTWGAGAREAAALGTLPGDTAWRGLSRTPFVLAKDSAVTLESRGGNPTLVARRYRAGRVLGVGYDETWRWRMAGGEESVAAHRDWWSRLVSSAAFTAEREDMLTGSAPLAGLTRVLGEPAPVADMGRQLPRAALSNILGALALSALLLEWLLRRARGAR